MNSPADHSVRHAKLVSERRHRVRDRRCGLRRACAEARSQRVGEEVERSIVERLHERES
jgi:hypothetical protein